MNVMMCCKRTGRITQYKGFLSDPFDTKIIIKENGLQFYVDIENGQKDRLFPGSAG